MTFWKWSKTPADNGTADSSCPWPEGMAPSQVNDSSRGGMAALAKYRDDISGSLLTTGTASAYAVSSNQGFDSLAHLDRAMIAFTPHVSNNGTPTLSVDGLAAKPIICAPSVALQPTVLRAGAPYVVFYDNTAGTFILHSYFYNIGDVPIGSGFDYWGAVIPVGLDNFFAWADGRAISRDYETCFGRLGTRYGSGNGSTTFNLPDKRGRVSAGLDNLGGTPANRLTTASGIDGTTLGAAGGAQTVGLTYAQLPTASLAVSIPSGQGFHTHGVLPAGVLGATAGVLVSQNDTSALRGGTPISIDAATLPAMSGSASLAGSGLAHLNVQPTITCNYLIRIL